MTNGEKFKTAEERSNEFNDFCSGYCKTCPAWNVKDKCHFTWLDLEYQPRINNCPICGSSKTYPVETKSCRPSIYFVECHECYTRGPTEKNKGRAIEQWNRLLTRN